MAPSFELAFAGRTLVGLGVSVTFIAMLKLVAVWFEESRFATLTGICMLIGNIGSILAGAPLAWLTQITSWREIFVGAGILSLLIGVASLLLVSDGPERPRGGMPVDRTAWLANLLLVLRNRTTWPGFFVNMGMAASFFSFAGLWAVPSFTQALGMTRQTASNHASLYFLGYAVGAMLLGADKRAAAEFSFFLAMPTMAGAFAYDLMKNYKELTTNDLTLIGIGFVTAFVSALIVVRSFLDFVSSRGFTPFAWWRVIVGTLGLIALALGK